jgi:hypothetical protein
VDLIDSISISAGKRRSQAKPSRTKQKTRHNTRVFIQNLKITQTLAMRMMVVMTTMVAAIRVRRNHRTSENNDCNGSKK